MRNIDRFWDPAPDMQLNIEAKYWNQDWLIIDNEAGIIDTPVSCRHRTYDGAYYAGRLWRYVGGSYIGLIKRVIYRILTRKFGIAFLRGFLSNKDWRCKNPRVIAYYRGKLTRIKMNLFGTKNGGE